MEIIMKECTKCTLSLPLDSFCAQKGGKYGKASMCKECKKEYEKSRPRPPIDKKHCSGCDKLLPSTSFWKGNGKGGLAGKCIKCSELQRSVRHARLAKETPSEAQCNDCEKVKPASCFAKGDSHGLLAGHCRDCDKVRRQRRIENIQPIDGKLCSQCNEYKLEKEFNKKNDGVGGLTPWCRECTSIATIARVERISKQEVVEKKCTKCELTLSIDCFVKGRGAGGRSHWCHKCRRQYMRDNLERIRINNAVRRRKESESLSTHDRKMSTLRCRRIKNFPCYYCNEWNEEMHIDHFIPLSRGGTTHFWNLVHACKPCNLSKNTRTGYEYQEILENK